jgi:hypothetical protein
LFCPSITTGPWWKKTYISGGWNLEYVVMIVLWLCHGLFHVLGVLVTFGVVVVERFLGAWHLDIHKVKKTDHFKDVLPLLVRPDVSIRIEEQLGQEDIARQPDNLLDDGGYGRVVGVRLDHTTTILDTLVRSRPVLSDDLDTSSSTLKLSPRLSGFAVSNDFFIRKTQESQKKSSSCLSGGDPRGNKSGRGGTPATGNKCIMDCRIT